MTGKKEKRKMEKKDKMIINIKCISKAK